MARTRQIKPDFFTDEDLPTCSPYARLLFAGLWTLCDRAGRIEDRPVKLRAQLFPYEPDVDVEALLEELARPKKYGTGTLITRYAGSDGRRYIQVNGFERHQNCHPKEPASQIPEPGPNTASHGTPRQAAAGRGETVSSHAESDPSVPSESDPSGGGDQSPSSDAPPPPPPGGSGPGLATVQCPGCQERGTIQRNRVTESRPEGGWFCAEDLGGCGQGFAATDPAIVRQLSPRAQSAIRRRANRAHAPPPGGGSLERRAVDPEAENVWEPVREALRPAGGPAKVHPWVSWIAPLTAVALEGGVLTLEAQSPTFCSYLAATWKERIEAALPDGLRVRFVPASLHEAAG